MSLTSPENKEQLEMYWEHNHFSADTEKRLKGILDAGKDRIPDIIFCPSKSCRTPVNTKIDTECIKLSCPNCGWAESVYKEEKENSPPIICQFFGQFTDEQKEAFQNAQKEDFLRLLEILKIEPGKEPKITFRVFDTREKKREADPQHSLSRASARFNEMAVYRCWLADSDPHFPHEITHLITHTWAQPYVWTVELPDGDKTIRRETEMVSTSFFQEGLAIAIDESEFGRMWFGSETNETLEIWIQKNIEKFEKITISECINFEGFNSFEDDMANAFAGSLSKYIIETFGLDKHKELYTRVRETNSVEQNIQVLEAIFGQKETVLINNWREWVLKMV
ncbi:MAG: hypothetical protein V1664_01620 [Candidatus Uhrbacteria bacterium]